MYLILRWKYVLRRRTTFFWLSPAFGDFNFISRHSQSWLYKPDAVRLGTIACFFAPLIIIACSLSACLSEQAGDPNLTKNTYIELVDWHVSGFMIINCPVAWIRVVNYNHVPIKDIEFTYITYDAAGQKLDEGTYTIEGTVPPQGLKNFIEQYLGLVDVHSERLTVRLKSVSAG